MPRPTPFRLPLVVLLLAGLGAVETGSAQPPPGRTTLVRAARIIDGRGGSPIVNGGVLIRGDRIERVGPAAGMLADQIIDLGTATILPGLIDLHTHLTDEVGTNWESALLTTTPGRAAIYGAVNARTTLMAGFTTCRDMGPTALRGHRPALRDRQGFGARAAPAGGRQLRLRHRRAGDARQFSIYVDVPIVRNLADGVDQVRQVVRTNLKHGADFIKIGDGRRDVEGHPAGRAAVFGRGACRGRRKRRGGASSWRRTRTAPRASRPPSAPACGPSTTAACSTRKPRGC
ncbi:MAG: amidohydrolase family protein [Vicinamibacterales bacterium]